MQPFTKGNRKANDYFFAGFVLLFSLLYVRLGYLSTSPRSDGDGEKPV